MSLRRWSGGWKEFQANREQAKGSLLALAAQTRAKGHRNRSYFIRTRGYFRATMKKNSQRYNHPIGTGPVVRQKAPTSSLDPFTSTELTFKPIVSNDFTKIKSFNLQSPNRPGTSSPERLQVHLPPQKTPKALTQDLLSHRNEALDRKTSAKSQLQSSLLQPSSKPLKTPEMGHSRHIHN